MTLATDITWIEGLIGGTLIGLASSLLLLGNGKIAGISGIIGGLFQSKKSDRSWRVLFIVGLVFGGIITSLINKDSMLFNDIPSFGRATIAAIFVGIGTAFGSGCTSGHGICGISRLSKRSILATITFMLTGFITVYLGV